MSSQAIRITLKAYDHRVLDLSAQQILEAAERTGAAVAGPIPMPTSIRRFCVLRSPHVNKKSREPVSYTHLTLPTKRKCRSRWSPYH